MTPNTLLIIGGCPRLFWNTQADEAIKRIEEK
jgi:hypothetical protein